MRSELSYVEAKLLEGLQTATLDDVAKKLGMKKQTAYVHLFNIRHKYDAAKAFVDLIEAKKNEYPNIAYHLRRKMGYVRRESHQEMGAI
jgi:hypothetical protein